MNTIVALETIRYAAAWHGDQKRRYTGYPYVTHLLSVASRVAQVYGDNTPTEVFQAAILHDIVEDTDVSVEDVRYIFGPNVAEMVEALTDLGLEHGNRATRKALMRERIAKASREVKIIKLADLLDNSSSIIDADPDFAKVYVKEVEALLPVLEGANETLHGELTRVVRDYYFRQELSASKA